MGAHGNRAMHVTIKPPASFMHAGRLLARHDRHDPRKPAFEIDELDIDLRDCEFVTPSATLWCIVYAVLSVKRGATVRLLVPNSMGVCVYLKSLGLFDTLKGHGIEVDDRNIGSGAAHKTILPVTPFTSTAEAAQVTNRAFERLQKTGVGAANLTSIVTELFSELALNAAQHSESEIGAFGCVQFYEFRSAPRFTCAVADGGIGVYASLCRNDKHRSRVSYDWDALELAVRERVSGTNDPHRGIGLYGVSEDVRRPDRSLLLHSGLGSLEIKETMEISARRTRLFPGTLAFLSIPA